MAKTMCTVLGIGFILVGIVGFLAPTLLGLHLSTAHNLVHIVSGALALYLGLSGTLGAARSFCLVFGAVYLLLGIAGFLAGDGEARMLTLIPGTLMLGLRDHLVHILLGALFLVGGLTTSATTARV